MLSNYSISEIIFTQNFVGEGKDNSEDSGVENVITE